MSTEKYIESVLSPLTKYPDKLQINTRIDAEGKLITINADKEDLPVLIGRQGRMVNALRIIIHTHGSINGEKVAIKIG